MRAATQSPTSEVPHLPPPPWPTSQTISPSSAMEILLKRIARRPTYTIGHLYIDGRYFCDTVEDTDRDLNRNGRFDNGEVKVYAQTAIPNGRYRVTMNVRSPKFSSRTEYNWWRVNGRYGYLPRPSNSP